MPCNDWPTNYDARQVESIERAADQKYRRLMNKHEALERVCCALGSLIIDLPTNVLIELHPEEQAAYNTFKQWYEDHRWKEIPEHLKMLMSQRNKVTKHVKKITNLGGVPGPDIIQTAKTLTSKIETLSRLYKERNTELLVNREYDRLVDLSFIK